MTTRQQKRLERVRSRVVAHIRRKRSKQNFVRYPHAAELTYRRAVGRLSEAQRLLVMGELESYREVFFPEPQRSDGKTMARIDRGLLEALARFSRGTKRRASAIFRDRTTRRLARNTLQSVTKQNREQVTGQIGIAPLAGERLRIIEEDFVQRNLRAHPLH